MASRTDCSRHAASANTSRPLIKAAFAGAFAFGASEPILQTGLQHRRLRNSGSALRVDGGGSLAGASDAFSAFTPILAAAGIVWGAARRAPPAASARSRTLFRVFTHRRPSPLPSFGKRAVRDHPVRCRRGGTRPPSKDNPLRAASCGRRLCLLRDWGARKAARRFVDNRLDTSGEPPTRPVRSEGGRGAAGIATYYGPATFVPSADTLRSRRHDAANTPIDGETALPTVLYTDRSRHTRVACEPGHHWRWPESVHSK